MRYRYLGRTGFKVNSEHILGFWLAGKHTWQVIEHLVAIATELQKIPAQIALNWLLQKPVVTSPIIGARSLSHLEDNLGETGWSLTLEQATRLDQAGDIPLPYPYESLV